MWEELLKKYDWANKTLVINRKAVNTSELAIQAVINKDLENLGKYYECSRQAAARSVSKYIPELPEYRGLLCNKILFLVGYCRCSKCEEIQEIQNFHANKRVPSGINSQCKSCSRTRVKEWHQDNPNKNRIYVARRKKHIIQRTPSWADLEKIEQIYKNCPEGHHVDHIVPLQGDKVSGLHVPENLQYLKAEDNLKKSNSFEVT